MPVSVSSIDGIVSQSAGLTVKLCIIAVTNMNIVLRANVSPAHSRLPAPNGNDRSLLKHNLPFWSRNRSGLNRSGCSQTVGSLCDAYSDVMTNEFCEWKENSLLKRSLRTDCGLTFGMSYPMNCVSSIVLCGIPDGASVTYRILSRMHASVYGKLQFENEKYHGNTKLHIDQVHRHR